MKVLKVIHGYPMRYNAGSEVYSQALCQGLAARHQVHVFTREEDPFAPDARLRTETDPDDPRIMVHLVNNPRNRDRYRVREIDARFAEVVDAIEPDIIHIGHLNHLSTSLVDVVKSRGIPIVFTLHDYWLMCPRGQFMQTASENPEDLWAACDGQSNGKCAERCYSRYFGGGVDDWAVDRAYWSEWVGRRMEHAREIAAKVDVFIAPARYLHARFRDDFGLPESRMIYLDYGFDHARLAGRIRSPGEAFTFGYIGTHIPAKGIHDLIRAFGELRGDAILRIWGRPRGQETAALQAMASALPAEIAKRVEWLPEYRNQDIVADVFNRVDAIVVPSVWVENSPLVIHEAQQVRVPVITADIGGMGEYVAHEINGLTFAHRSFRSLAQQMQRFVDEPSLAVRLGLRGYLGSDTGDVPELSSHVREIEALYDRVLPARSGLEQASADGPWRITFDTNPDTCNLRCVMCEEHSPHRRQARPSKTRREMPFELFERVVAEAAPRGLREIIPSTMGEPLLYAHFDGILDLCRRYGVKLNLTTNGTFPRLGADAWAARIVPYASDVKISWNGATRATHEAIMKGTRWEQVLENVRGFVAVRDAHAAGGGNRCRVTFQLTFLETNVGELADIVRLAIDLGVDRVKGHHLWAHFNEVENLSMRRHSDAARRWNAAVEAAKIAAAERFLPNGNRILLENIVPLPEDVDVPDRATGSCPFLGQEAWVSALGRFDPCCAPDAERRALGEFGNLHDRGLMDIWTDRSYRNLVEGYQKRDLCGRCTMRKAAETAS